MLVPCRYEYDAHVSAWCEWRLAARALLHADLIVQRWLPNGCREPGVRGGSEWAPTRPAWNCERGPGVTVQLLTGEWLDSNTKTSGNDLITLAAFLHQLNNQDALNLVSDLVDQIECQAEQAKCQAEFIQFKSSWLEKYCDGPLVIDRLL